MSGKGKLIFEGLIKSEASGPSRPLIDGGTPPVRKRFMLGHGTYIPTELTEVDGLNFPMVRFDPSRSASGLNLENENRRVTGVGSPSVWKCAYATQGFSSGCHYWSFAVINKGVHSNIMIGVSDGTTSVTESSYPGKQTECSLLLYNGHYYRSNTSVASQNPTLVKEATTIGVLLDMDRKNVTFFADGKRVGTGADKDVLTANKYFPVISLNEAGSSLEIQDSLLAFDDE